MDRVIVHDVGSLDTFRYTLKSKRDELEALFRDFFNLTSSQSSNWQDAQYEHLKSEITQFCNSGHLMLSQLDESIIYISNLVTKLREL